MFFIFGSPRSGTTLLAQCLDAHDQIVVPHETDFIIPTAFIFDRIADPELRKQVLSSFIPHTNAFPNSLGEFLSRDELIDLISQYSATPDQLLMATYAAVAKKGNAILAGDKSPNDLLFLRMLIKVGAIPAEAKIIHIVRDVRDVIDAIIGAKMTIDPETWFPRLWSTSNLYLYEQFRSNRNYKLIRYEDFVHAPTTILEEVCHLLGISYTPSMVDVTRRHPRYRQMVSHKKLFEPISDKWVGSYRARLAPEIVAICDRQGVEALTCFGYRQ